jgi:hypothetical protein
MPIQKVAEIALSGQWSAFSHKISPEAKSSGLTIFREILTTTRLS